MKKILMLCCMIAMVCSCTKIEDIQNSVIVTDCRLSSPNSVGGCDLDLKFKNISGKTMKYINFDFDFINAVGEAVPCEIWGWRCYKEVTGPMYTNTEYEVHWDAIVYNRTAKSVKIRYIYIEFMDGSDLEITEKNLHYIGL